MLQHLLGPLVRQERELLAAEAVGDGVLALRARPSGVRGPGLRLPLARAASAWAGERLAGGVLMASSMIPTSTNWERSREAQGPSVGMSEVSKKMVDMARRLPPGTSEEVRRSIEVADMFRGSRDFFLAYQLLGAFMASADAREGRAPSPVQSHAASAAFALELALKARVVLDGREPPSRGPDGHKYGAIFALLSPGAREDVASSLQVDGEPVTAEMLAGVLQELEGTFEKWRYMHEHDEMVFREGNMVAVMHAVYASIVRLRPDFGPWPGVIVDPVRPVPWHLTPP